MDERKKSKAESLRCDPIEEDLQEILFRFPETSSDRTLSLQVSVWQVDHFVLSEWGLVSRVSGSGVVPGLIPAALPQCTAAQHVKGAAHWENMPKTHMQNLEISDQFPRKIKEIIQFPDKILENDFERFHRH